MALTLPTVDDLITFWGDDGEDIDQDRADVFIQLAANLLWLATDLEDDPTDPRLNMLVNFAICDMAIYLYVTREDLEASYSQFQSETIGAYSYSKSYKAIAQNVASGAETGVPLFDRLVRYFVDQAFFGGTGLVSSEHVFTEGYISMNVAAHLHHYFPSNYDPTSRSEWYVVLQGTL